MPICDDLLVVLTKIVIIFIEYTSRILRILKILVEQETIQQETEQNKVLVNPAGPKTFVVTSFYC